MSGRKVKRRTFAAVEVIWIDAHGGDEGWVKLHGRHSKPAEIRTVGMLAKSSKDGLTVTASHDKDAGLFGGYVFIPHVNVVTMRELS